MSKDSAKADKKDIKKKKNNVKQKTKSKTNDGYFKEVRKELKLVKWPSAKEVIKYTISTIIFCAILCGIFMLLNLLMSLVKGWVG